MVRPQKRYKTLFAARQRQATPEFAAVNAMRVGIEGTMPRGVRTCTLRRSRHVGQARTHLGLIFTATTLTFLRLGEWLSNFPRARSRRASFARRMAQPVIA